MNINSEKFAEEQRKYLEYFKLKKASGKSKESEFNEFLSKKGNELSKLEKIDISILSKNLSTISDQINSLLNQSYAKNAFFEESAK